MTSILYYTILYYDIYTILYNIRYYTMTWYTILRPSAPAAHAIIYTIITIFNYGYTIIIIMSIIINIRFIILFNYNYTIICMSIIILLYDYY